MSFVESMFLLDCLGIVTGPLQPGDLYTNKIVNVCYPKSSEQNLYKLQKYKKWDSNLKKYHKYSNQ